MAYNDTSEQWNWYIPDNHYYATILTGNVLSFATFIYGVTSWCILKKFRNYRNYLFLNVIFVNFLLGTLQVLGYYLDLYDVILQYHLLDYIVTAKTHWVVVVSHMCYVDFVKIFNANIQNRYIKSCIFGWGLSLVTTMYFMCPYIQESSQNFVRDYLPSGYLNTIILEFVNFGNQIISVIINCFLYIIIVFSLFRSFNTSGHTASNIWRRLYIATLIFILSDVLLVYDNFIQFVFTISPVVEFFIKVLSISNSLLLDVFFVIIRSNRKIWNDYYVAKLNKTRRNNEINMRDGISQETGFSSNGS